MAALTQLPTIKASINSTQFLIECPKIQSILHTTIDSSVCRNFFDGLFVYFLCAFCTSIFLYVVLCTSSVMWSYYDPFYWFLNPDDARDIEGGGITEFEDGDNSYAKEIPIADSNASFYDEKSNEIVDPIPIASPSRPLAKKASIFELLVMNENEQRLALKEIELRENAKKKKRSAIGTTASIFFTIFFKNFDNDFYYIIAMCCLQQSTFLSIYLFCIGSSDLISFFLQLFQIPPLLPHPN